MNKVVHLSLARKSTPAYMDVVEQATAPEIDFILDDYTPPAGATAQIYIKKGDAEVFNTCTIQDNVVHFAPTPGSFDVAGSCVAQVQIIYNDEVAVSYRIFVTVEPNLIDGGAIEASSEYGALVDALETVGDLSRIESDVEYLKSQDVVLEDEFNIAMQEISGAKQDIDVLEAQIQALIEGGSVDPDAELVDIRIGYDGTNYPTAGNAVRSQIGNLEETLNDLGIAIPYSLISGGRIKDDGTLEVISEYSYTDYLEVVPNSKVIVHTVLAAASGVIAVYDENQNFLFYTNTGQGTADFIDVIVDVPSNGKYIRCTCYNYRVDTSKFSAKYKANIIGLKNEIDFLGEAVNDLGVIIPFSLIEGKRINSTGGETIATGYVCTDYVEVVPNSDVVVHTVLPSSSSGVAIYDENYNFIEFTSKGAGSASNFIDIDIHIPLQGKYIRCTCYSYKVNTGNFSIKYRTNLVELEALKPTIEQLADIYNLKRNLFIANWIAGSMYNGNYSDHYTVMGRVTSKDFIKFPFPISISINSGYRFFLSYYTDEDASTYTGASSWSTSEIIVPANQIFRITIGKVPEASSVSSVEEYYQNLIWDKVDENAIITLNEDVLLNAQASCSYGINASGTANAKKNISLLITTDVHGYAEGIKRAVQYLNYMPFVDFGVCLGDMTPQYYSDSNGRWYTDSVNLSIKPFFTIIGNHDGGNSKEASKSATVAESFNKWIKPTRDIIGLPSLSTPYYKIENSTYKIAMVFLNNYDVPDTRDGNNDFVVSRGSEVISQTQIDWLLSTLDNVPSDYTLILFAHSFPYANTSQQGNWTEAGKIIAGNSIACYEDIIPDIINAWKTGGNLNKTYTPRISGVNESVVVNHSFSTRGAGEFACHVVGHMHHDIIAHSTSYSDQLIISLCATAFDNWQNGDSDLPRVAGEKSQDAITLLSVNPDADYVNLVRLGSNKTIRMVDRTMISLDYT